jgi:hypothetical protein
VKISWAPETTHGVGFAKGRGGDAEPVSLLNAVAERALHRDRCYVSQNYASWPMHSYGVQQLLSNIKVGPTISRPTRR